MHVCVHVQQGAIDSHTHRHTEGIWAARQLRVIQARSICSGVTQMTVNNIILMTVAVTAALSIHHSSGLVSFPPFLLAVLFWRENLGFSSDNAHISLNGCGGFCWVVVACGSSGRELRFLSSCMYEKGEVQI